MSDYKEYYSFTKRSVEEYDEVDRVEIGFQDVHLDSIIQRFESFLRGCGFHFDGNLQIVNDDEIL